MLTHTARGNLSVDRLYEGPVNGLALVQRLGTPAQVSPAARRRGGPSVQRMEHAGA